MQHGLTSSPESARSIRAVPAVLGGLGVALVLLCTSRYGVGMAPDSANYIAAARSLLAGSGYRYCDGGIYTHWPPLFPTLLAGLGLAGVDPTIGARLLNAAAFGAIIFLSARLFSRCVTSGVFLVLGTLSVALSAPLLAVSVMAYSEPIFIVLVILFLLCAADFLQTGNWRLLLAMAVLAGLSCLQRYAGVTLILTGGLLIVLAAPRISIWRRLGYAAGFGAVSCAPLVFWIARNRAVAGETVGAHRFHLRSIGEVARSAMAAADVMAAWLYPPVAGRIVNAVAVGLILLLAGVAVILSCHRWRDSRQGIRPLQIGVVAVFGLIYVGFLVLSGAGLAWNPDERVLLPAYVIIMVLLFSGVEYASGRLGARRLSERSASLAGLVLCLLWLSHPVHCMGDCVAFRLREGAGDYSTRTWRQSPLMCWLQANPLPGAIYSNVPDAIYALTGRCTQTSPHNTWDAAKFAEVVLASQASYIVWSNRLRRDFLYDLPELLSRWRMEEVAAFSDGAVYRFLSNKGDPGVVGVHRFWLRHNDKHLYILDRRQSEAVNLHQGRQCRDEGMAFYVPASDPPADALPVHRLYSAALDSWFYTMDEVEKDELVQEHSGLWRYEGIAWYAWPQDHRPAGTLPVYRFWSDALQNHFYTIEEGEREMLIQKYAHMWRYEGIAWYAYGK